MAVILDGAFEAFCNFEAITVPRFVTAFVLKRDTKMNAIRVIARAPKVRRIYCFFI